MLDIPASLRVIVVIDSLKDWLIIFTEYLKLLNRCEDRVFE